MEPLGIPFCEKDNQNAMIFDSGKCIWKQGLLEVGILLQPQNANSIRLETSCLIYCMANELHMCV